MKVKLEDIIEAMEFGKRQILRLPLNLTPLL